MTPRDVGAVLSSQGRAVLRASAAVVYVVIDDHLELLASDGYPEGHLSNFGRLALDAPAPVTDMIRRRAPMYLSRRAMEAEYPAIAQAGVLASKQVFGVPVLLDAEPLGAAFFGFQTTTRLTTAERAMALAMADQAAQALYRARLYEVSLEAEAHVRILQEVTASLADAFTVDTVASVVLRESTSRVDAVAAALTLAVPSDPTTMRLAAAVGFPDDVRERWQQFPIDAPIPVGECMQADDLVMIPTRSEMVERYPQLGRETTAERGASGVWVPIPGRRGPVGVVAYFFADERNLGKDDPGALPGDRLAVRTGSRARRPPRGGGRSGPEGAARGAARPAAGHAHRRVLPRRHARRGREHLRDDGGCRGGRRSEA